MFGDLVAGVSRLRVDPDDLQKLGTEIFLSGDQTGQIEIAYRESFPQRNEDDDFLVGEVT
ncbi:MAG: hypothetical protein JWN70_7030, partial [Planctomycetaceae bacterium]|nr:hypothetical protein [Planctomycetaceae bacterium]